MFDEALDGLCSWVEVNGWSKVALQFPEGIKSRAQGLIDALTERTSCSFIIMGDPCYGACDVPRDFEDYAEALVQFGHSRIPGLPVGDNVMFIEMRADVGLSGLINEALPHLGQKVGLLATLQYLDLIGEAEGLLRSAGKDVAIGEGDRRISYPGQVLGCNHSSSTSIADHVDGFLFLGEGNFHALAASLGTGKSVTVLDPVRREIRSMDQLRDRLLRQRFAAISASQEAGSFLVIVSGKTGQRRQALADRAVDLIRSKGRRAYSIVLEEISPSALLHYKADAYVSTACPRVAIDDAGMFSRPMLTFPELQIALGVLDWEGYIFDSIED